MRCARVGVGILYYKNNHNMLTIRQLGVKYLKLGHSSMAVVSRILHSNFVLVLY